MKKLTPIMPEIGHWIAWSAYSGPGEEAIRHNGPKAYEPTNWDIGVVEWVGPGVDIEDEQAIVLVKKTWPTGYVSRELVRLENIRISAVAESIVMAVRTLAAAPTSRALKTFEDAEAAYWRTIEAAYASNVPRGFA